MSNGKRGPANELDKAMQDALESVERREQESASEDIPTEARAQADGDPDGDPDAGAELAEARAALETKTNELATMRDQLLRLGADFENLRKRSLREADDARKFGMERLARDILPVIDNLERALQHAKGGDPVIDGVRMVAKQLLDVLGSFGVKAFDSLNQMFDPERHEALSQVPGTDSAPGTVVAEMQRGYTIQDRLLRPAQVAIAAPKTESADEANASPADRPN